MLQPIVHTAFNIFTIQAPLLTHPIYIHLKPLLAVSTLANIKSALGLHQNAHKSNPTA